MPFLVSLVSYAYQKILLCPVSVLVGVCLTPYLILQNHVSKHTQLHDVITKRNHDKPLSYDDNIYDYLTDRAHNWWREKPYISVLWKGLGEHCVIKRNAQKARPDLWCYQFHWRPFFSNGYQLSIVGSTTASLLDHGLHVTCLTMLNCVAWGNIINSISETGIFGLLTHLHTKKS